MGDYIFRSSRKVKNNDIQSLNTNGVKMNNQQIGADVLNNYFIIIADNITNRNKRNTTENDTININMIHSCVLFHWLSQQNILTWTGNQL